MVGASADLAVEPDVFEPWAFAIMTAKYGRNTAPAANRTVNHPRGTTTARTTQTALMIMATVYLMKRERRSCSGETSNEVTD